MPIPESLLAKLVHAAAGGAGASAALVILVPTSRKEAFARGFVGVLCAIVCVAPTLHFFGIAPSPDNAVFAAYTIGFAAWFLLGAAARTLDRWRKGGVREIVDDLRDLLPHRKDD